MTRAERREVEARVLEAEARGWRSASLVVRYGRWKASELPDVLDNAADIRDESATHKRTAL